MFGLQGEHAHRIWHAIYSQSCFDHINCTETRVFHRLLSGMHSSISAHLSNSWLLDEPQDKWGANLDEFKRRLGSPDVRHRIENLYFAYLFVLRAVKKAEPMLNKFQFSTGIEHEDRKTQQLMKQLVINLTWRKAFDISTCRTSLGGSSIFHLNILIHSQKSSNGIVVAFLFE